MNELHEYAETHGQTKFPWEPEGDFIKRIYDFKQKRERGLKLQPWRRENVIEINKSRDGDRQ